MKKLSKRLLLIAKQVNKENIICDVGTDHAKIPIYLAKRKIITKAYVCDIAKQPLLQAKKNIAKYNLEKIIIPILGYGLTKILKIKINSCIISGLGSKTILNILKEDVNLICRYIFCSNDDPYLLRKWIKSQKYFIEKELIIKENNFIYEIIVVNKIVGEKIKNKQDVMFGPLLRKINNNLFQEKWLLKKNII